MKKSSCRYYHITQVYHKWQSYDLWFLRYWVQQTDFFVILGHFLSFYPTNNSQNQNSEKMKKCLEIPSFYTSGSNNHMQVWQVMDIRYSRWWIWFEKKWKHQEISSFYTFTHVRQKLWSHDVLFLKYGEEWIDKQIDRRTKSRGGYPT